jgi:tRNA(Ile)-lysidine synthetase-like protein
MKESKARRRKAVVKMRGPVWRMFCSSLDSSIARFRLPQKAVGVCFSGGPDSLALLKLTQEWCRQRRARLVALHVNHALREEADEEAVWLEGQLQRLKVEMLQRRLVWGTGCGARDATHAKARELRHAALAGMASEAEVGLLLMAHHADDVAETFVERLHMASGLAGLARPIPQVGTLMRPHENVAVVRPLLGVRKSELVALVGDQQFLSDRYNRDPRFLRSRIRQKLEENSGLTEELLGVLDWMRAEWDVVEDHADALEMKYCRNDEVVAADILDHVRPRKGATVEGIAARAVITNLTTRVRPQALVMRSTVLDHLLDWMNVVSASKEGSFKWSEGGVLVVYRRKKHSFLVTEADQIKRATRIQH